VPQRFRGSTCHVTSPTSLTIESSQGKKLFVFDRVFGPDIDQEGVYAYLNESVKSFLEGYNVSILAYGQSGAGKSYTMGTTGPAEQNDAQIMGTYFRLLQRRDVRAPHATSRIIAIPIVRMLIPQFRRRSSCCCYTFRKTTWRQIRHQVSLAIFHVTRSAHNVIILERRREELGDEGDIRRGSWTRRALVRSTC
jgi:hypothetical protein